MSLALESGEQKLWRAVLAQAFVDATSTASGNFPDADIQRARDWLTKSSRHFTAVCHLAGACPEKTRKAALRLIAEVEANPGVNLFQRRLEWNGRSLNLSQWARETGIPLNRIESRLRRGWTVERALTVSVEQELYEAEPRLTHNGQTLTYREWEAISGIPASLIRDRIRRDWKAETAIFSPKIKNGEAFKKYHQGRSKVKPPTPIIDSEPQTEKETSNVE